MVKIEYNSNSYQKDDRAHPQKEMGVRSG